MNDWFIINSSSSTDFVVNINDVDVNITVAYKDPIEQMQSRFAALTEKFFDGREFHTTMEIIQRWQRDKRLATLIQAK